ncbi:MAG: methyltransferase domain-containing protein [Janthinobacterium lividum]
MSDSNASAQLDITVFSLDSNASAMLDRRFHGKAEFARVKQAFCESLPAAGKVLECGFADDLLARLYKQSHPQATWHGIAAHARALAAPLAHFDQVFARDLDSCEFDDLDDPDGGYDLLVLADVFDYLHDPARLLRVLHKVCAAQVMLVCCIPNRCHIAVVEQMLAGDLSLVAGDGPGRPGWEFLAPRATIKAMMDAGWIPHLVAANMLQPENPKLATAMVDAAAAIRLSSKTAAEILTLSHLVFHCKPSPWRVPGVHGAHGAHGVQSAPAAIDGEGAPAKVPPATPLDAGAAASSAAPEGSSSSGWAAFPESCAVPAVPEVVAGFQAADAPARYETHRTLELPASFRVPASTAPQHQRQPRMKISIVAPVNDEAELQRQLLASPGLLELDAQIILCRHASSAAQAFEAGLAQATADWVVYCHQDV